MKARRIPHLRRLTTRCAPAALLLAGFVLLPAAAHAQTDVLANRYDNGRVGANLNETTLTPANVNAAQFGKLYSYVVDGAIYAQPLYVKGVTIRGVVRNVLYVATMNDKVYAFDANSASSVPLWMVDLTSPPEVTAVPATDIVSPSTNIFGNVGIEGTPVIDRVAGTIYFVARTKESGAYVQRLHALDMTTGQERSGSPVTITGSVPKATAGQVLTFNPKMHQQRAGLALANGVVLVAWAAHQDKKPYNGWIMGFDAATLAKVGTFAACPDGDGGGIWQGGRAPTIDAAGNAYFTTGNGAWDGVRNFGDSLLKFRVSRTGLTLVDFFTPGNEATLNLNDDDLSGSSFTLLPATNLMLGGGKEGVLYLVDATNLGRKVADDTQIVQKILVNGGHVMGGPVFWDSDNAGPLIYNWSEDDVLVAYRLVDGKLSPVYAKGQVRSPGHPGGSLTISANGSTANTGIVWASMPTSTDAKNRLAAGVLRAYHAETLQEIWTSEQNPTRDRLGTTIKFVPPVVVDGKVYLSNQEGQVVVYGLLPPDPRPVPPDIVLYAKDAAPIVGNWQVVADVSAAGGARIANANLNAAKVTTAVAAPRDYFELTFTAQQNVPYRLWIRGRAFADSYNNDSVFAQFSGSVTATGTPVYRIGTTDGTAIVLEDCSGCGVSGWGWQDNGYGAGVFGPALYFTGGTQTIRVQPREDGLSIDQIVLSPGTYLGRSPGLTKGDATILPQRGAAATIVRYPGLRATARGSWRFVPDVTAAGGTRVELPDAGVPKLTVPLAAPSSYVELTFDAVAKVPYRLWLRGKAAGNSYNNDSVYLQFSGSVTSTGTPVNRIGTTEASAVVLEDCNGCGVAGWGWQDNGYGTGVLGPVMYFDGSRQTVRIQGREDGLSIDQFVLSPDAYLSSPPGAVKNDATILPESAAPSGTIVRYAAMDAVPHGTWRIVADTTAAGGNRLEHPDLKVPKITTPLANPADYVELTFTAVANVPYRLWLRGKAQNDSYLNDSVWVQFSGSVTSGGTAVNRIGTAEGVPIVLEDCSGCGVQGWGWQDDGYGTGVLGPLMYFTAGTQTLRIQGREDGISIDQIVLSPDTFLKVSPGLPKNDTTILPRKP